MRDLQSYGVHAIVPVESMSTARRRLKGVLLVTVGAAVILAPLSLAAPSVSQPQSAVPAVARTYIGLPDPITMADADRWIRVLGLDAEAGNRMKSVVAEYISTQDAELARIFSVPYALAEELAVNSLSSSPEALNLFRDAVRARRTAVNRVTTLEEPLYRAAVAAAAVEAEPDPAAIDAVRQARRRTRFAILPCMLPMAQLDLRRVAMTLEADEPLGVEDREAWTAAWGAHDVELAMLHEQRIDWYLACLVAGAESELRVAGDMDAIVRSRTERMNHKLKIERSILGANDRWTALLAGLLDDSSAGRFRNEVQATLYPALYPSDVDLTAVLERISGLPADGDPDVADPDPMRDLLAVVGAEVARLQEQERLLESKIMEVAVRESRSMVSPRRRQELEAMIEALYAERRESGRRVLELCGALPELNDDPLIARLRAACAEEAEHSDGQGIVDPFGRGDTRRPWVERVPPPAGERDAGRSEE